MKAPAALHRLRSRSGLAVGLLAAAVCLAFPPAGAGTARGALIVNVESTLVAAGSTGNAIDVYLTNTGPSAVTIGGFSFEVTAGSPEISFTSATINTVIAAYIFAGHSLFGPTISTSTGQTLAASDIYDDVPTSGATVGAGATVGLGHLFFDASAAASGLIPVTFTAFPSTSLSDQDGNNVPIDSLVGGTIAIQGPNPPTVPEPATLAPAALAALAAARRLRRRRGLSPFPA